MFQFRLRKLFVAMTLLGLVFAWLRLVLTGTSDALPGAFLCLWIFGLPGVVSFVVWRDIRAFDKTIFAIGLLVAWTSIDIWLTFLGYACAAYRDVTPWVLFVPLALLFPVIAVFQLFMIRALSKAWRDRHAAEERVKRGQ